MNFNDRENNRSYPSLEGRAFSRRRSEVPDVVEGAAKTHVKDDFGFEMLCQGEFTAARSTKILGQRIA